MAILAALGIPVILISCAVGVELYSLHKDHKGLQDAADAAALVAARQLRVAANDAALNRTQAYVTANTKHLAVTVDEPLVEFVKGSSGATGVRVMLTGRRMSFFGNMLPPGGFIVRAESTAMQVGSTPLCVLGLGTGGPKSLDFPSARVTANACLIHSNRDVEIGGTSVISAAAIHAAGAVRGTASNTGSGAAMIDDPLAGMFAGVSPGGCTQTGDVEVEDSDEVAEVNPGVHCRHFDIERGTLRFRPGVHHFKTGELQLKKGAKIEGDNVTLIIWKPFKIDFSDGKVPLLDLTGNQGGAGENAHWAGFVLAIDPERTEDLKLDFNEIRKLEGVVYAPNTRLIVPGGIDASEITPWTVVVARDLRVEGNRQLFINADYASSAVPVPDGVGNKASDGGPVRLTR